jgi:phosphoglucomutase
METNMILSASGWRKVFAISGDEQDRTAMIGEDNIAISIYSAAVFA